MKARHGKRQRLVPVPSVLDPFARPAAVDLPPELSILPLPTKSSTSSSTRVRPTTTTSARTLTTSTLSRTSITSTSSTASTITSESESSSSFSTSTTTSSPVLTSTTPSITPTPAATYATTSNGVVRTVTTFLEPSPSASDKPANNLSSTPKGFLQNKTAAGTVFGVLGFLALICIIVVATFAIKRRRKNRLIEEAVSFDPSVIDAATSHHYGEEKLRGPLGTSRAPTPQSNNDYAFSYYGGGGMGPSMSAAPGPQRLYKPTPEQMGNNMQYPSRLAYAQYAPSGSYTRG